MPVYFLQAEDKTGPIKIGWAKDVYKRLGEIQNMSPTRLVILGVLECEREEEYTIHNIFSTDRLYGEWFNLSTELLNFIRPLPIPEKKTSIKNLCDIDNIAAKVRALRAWLGLSQTEFGNKIGVSITTVSAWEAGRGNPKPENVQKINETFGIPLETIDLEHIAL
jgi:DNA-binding XRE family transcriptional regulator